MALHRHHHKHHAREALDTRDFWSDLAEDAKDAFKFPGGVFQDKAKKDETTVVSFVFKTKSATGEIIGWRTVTTEEPAPTPVKTTPTPKAKSTPPPALVVDTTTQKPKTAATTTSAPKKTSSVLPESIIAPSSTSLENNGLVVATSSLDLPSSTGLPTETAAIVNKGTTGMSAGGQAGLAIGILCLVGTIAGVLFFCFKKRRNAKREALDDEKTEVWGGAERAASTRTATNAPRLSLRPVTQFLPNLGGDRRQSRGNALAMTSASANRASHRPNSWEAPMSQQEGNRHNPFGTHAEQIDPANATGPPAIEAVNAQGRVVTAAVAGAAVGAVATGAAVGLTRGASKRENGPKALDLTTKNKMLPSIDSPVGTEFSMSSEPATPSTPTAGAAAIAAAGGPANSAVHRVQLDFKPSMDDELELRAGQLIRLLHEYDDGWVSLLFSIYIFYI